MDRRRADPVPPNAGRCRDYPRDAQAEGGGEMTEVLMMTAGFALLAAAAIGGIVWAMERTIAWWEELE